MTDGRRKSRQAGAGPAVGSEDASPLVDQTVARIRARVLAREFAPGRSLPAEGQLAAAFGVSRNVIREAMRTLRGEGLVDLAQGRVARVKEPDPGLVSDRLRALLETAPERSLLHLLDVRRALETEGAALASRHRSAADLDRLAAAVDELEQAGPVNDRVAADLRFHLALATATANPLYPLLMTAVLPLFQEFIARVTIGDGSHRAAQAHARILDMIKRGDAERARREVHQHLDTAEDDIRRTIKG